MLRQTIILGLCLLFSSSLTWAEDPNPRPDDWPQFRGWRAGGIAPGESPPLQWDVESSTNVAWKTAIPGLGHASPIVAGDFVFILTAVDADGETDLKVGLYGAIAPVDSNSVQTWQLMCLSKRTGFVFWTKTVHTGVPKIKRHTKATHANSTPAADRIHVVVFLGSEGLHCFDYLGNLLWKKDLGTMDSGYYRTPSAQWGFGSSPIIFENKVIVQCDVQENSFIAAFNIDTGKEVWRTPREEVPTWCTPTIYKDGGESVLLVNGYKHVGGYDPYTGKERWKYTGGGDIPTPTPVAAHGLAFLSTAHGANRPLTAVDPLSHGELLLKDAPAESKNSKTETASDKSGIAWSKPREGIYQQSPIVVGDYLFTCRGNGTLSCYQATTGTRLYRKRLGKGTTGFTASPVAVNGLLLITSEEGTVYTIKAGPEFEQIAQNEMQDICMASPAISNGVLYVRTKSHLYAIGQPKPRVSNLP